MILEKERSFFVVIAILWTVSAVAGMGYLWKYKETPGATAAAKDWPAASVISPDTETATFLLMLHPHCPCSKASLGELSRLTTQAKGRLKTYVVFVSPKGMTEEWAKDELWKTASSIPGVNVMLDVDSVEAERFQAATSGQGLLFDKNGKLLFKGGITSARGHEGDNNGRSAIVSILNGEQPQQDETPVFGCALFAQDTQNLTKIGE